MSTTLNGLELVRWYQDGDSKGTDVNRVCFILSCRLKDALALDGQTLTIETDDVETQAFPGYTVFSVSIGEGGYTYLWVSRKANDLTLDAVQTLRDEVATVSAKVDAIAEKVSA